MTVSRTAPVFSVHALKGMLRQTHRGLDRVVSTSSCFTEEAQRWSWECGSIPSFEKPGMVVNVCNNRAQKVEAGGTRSSKSSFDTQ